MLIEQPESKPQSVGRMGEFHLEFNLNIVSNVDPSDTNWHEVDLSSYLPPNVVAVAIIWRFTSSTAGHEFYWSDSDGGSVYSRAVVPVANQNIEMFGIVKVERDSIYYKASNSAISGLHMTLIGYWI